MKNLFKRKSKFDCSFEDIKKIFQGSDIKVIITNRGFDVILEGARITNMNEDMILIEVVYAGTSFRIYKDIILGIKDLSKKDKRVFELSLKDRTTIYISSVTYE